MTNELLEQLTDFIIEHLPLKDRDKIKEVILIHEGYGTLDYCLDSKGVAGFVRYNIKDDVCEVLDFAVRKDFRKKHIGTNFLIRGLHKWNCKTLKFYRFKTGSTYEIPIKRILKTQL